MSIKKLLLEGEESKKNISKTFRLRPAALEGLEKIAQRSKISQNEVLNVLLQTSYEELEIIRSIESKLRNVASEKKSSNQFVRVAKNFNGVYSITFNLSFDLKCELELKEVTQKEVLLKRNVDIDAVEDLLLYGLDSEFQVSYVTVFKI